MSGKDYYEILGITRNATKKEIEEAYRKKAKQFHPDINKSPDATEKMQEINKAYEVLSDPQKKEMYDNNTYGDTAEDYYDDDEDDDYDDDEDDDYYTNKYKEEEKRTLEEIKTWFKEKYDGWLQEQKKVYRYDEFSEEFGSIFKLENEHSEKNDEWLEKIFGDNIKSNWLDDDKWFEKEYDAWLKQFDSWVKNINDKYVEEWSKKNYWEWREEQLKIYSSYRRGEWRETYYSWLSEQFQYWLERKHKVQEKYFQWFKTIFDEWEIKNRNNKGTNEYYWWLVKRNDDWLKNSYASWLKRGKQSLLENQTWLNKEDERWLTKNYSIWLKKYNYWLLLKEVESKWFKKKNFNLFLKKHVQSFEYEKKLWLRQNYNLFIKIGNVKELKKLYNKWLSDNYNKWQKDTNSKKRVKIPYGVIINIFWLNFFLLTVHTVCSNVFLFIRDEDGYDYGFLFAFGIIGYISQIIFFIFFLLLSIFIIINERKKLSKKAWIWMIIYTLIVIMNFSFQSFFSLSDRSVGSIYSFIFSILCFFGYFSYLRLCI